MDHDSSRKTSSFWTQSDALLRKNLTYQKRNAATNCRLISFPSILCIILAITQGLVDKQLNKPSNNRCACNCVDSKGNGECQQVCDAHYSILDQDSTCGIPNPPEWPALLHVPEPKFRAVRNTISSSTDLPNESCRISGSCPVTVLVTGNNQTLGQILAGTMFTTPANVNSSDLVSLADVVLGSTIVTGADTYFEVGFTEYNTLHGVKSQCQSNSTLTVSIQQPGVDVHKEATCVQSLTLWRNSSTLVNDELYKGYQNGNIEKKINEILAAYDFLDSSGNKFNVIIWYNSTQDDYSTSSRLFGVPRLVNLVTNAYLQALHGSGTKILLEFVKKFPKHATYEPYFDVTSLLSTLFFTWVVLQLFPVVLTSLVYEKQQNLRIMMKMHGLGYGPYWLITYAYFLVVSLLYILVFVVFGSLVGLKFFTLNDLSIQFVFYFIYINLQITFAFLAAAFFSNVKTATAVSYICVFGSGLIGEFVFKSFIEDTSFPRAWIIVLELYPAFTLYHGLYEFAQYASMGSTMRDKGMRWTNLKDEQNGMSIVLIVMFVEWLLALFVAYYIDQVLSTGGRKTIRKRQPSAFRNTSLQRQGSKVFVDMEKPDVCQERETVEQLLLEPTTSHAIICDNLGKVYPGRDGNPEKLAVRGLSLALPRGECFGLLGPNGAGKTSFISMMIGLTNPSSGTAYVEGMDIRTEMDWIYTSMGVCPQHDLLWESLTGREHLLFYGRLKNLKGSALKRAVEESLKSVNLLNGGVADKQAGKYSGGMKRRLSVAISLIGDPKVVYMDEPSTGLDPASRRNLWNAVKRAKQNRAIILTTHSMEEAEVLCDRIGIFVDGGLQCIGNPKELKARYGESYVFSMTTSLDHEAEVVDMVRGLSPNAVRTYHTSGTQKFEIPKHEVKIAEVFHAVEVAKGRFPVFAWGLSDTTLEDVFIKVATGA